MDPDPSFNSGDQQLVDVGRYLRAASRQWLIVLALTILGGVAGSLYADVAPKTYTATAVVQVAPNLTAVSSAGPLKTAPNMDTEVQIAMSTTVVELAVKKLPGLTATQFLAAANASYPNKANTLSLAFAGTTPQQGVQGAQAWADAYIALHQSLGTSSLKAQTAQVTENLKAPEAALAKAEKEAAAATAGTALAARLDAKASALGNQLVPIRAQLDVLNAVVVDPGTLISVPNPPSRPDGPPGGGLFVTVGILVGALLGISLALVIESLTDRVRSADDLRRATTLPLWTTLSRRGDDRAVAAIAARITSAIQEGHISSVILVSPATGALDLMGSVMDKLEGDGVPFVTIRDVEEALRPGFGAARKSKTTVLLLAADNAASDPRVAAIAGRADATLLVAHPGKTSARQIRSTLSCLEQAGATPIGVILSAWRADRGSSYAAVPQATRGTSSSAPPVVSSVGTTEQPIAEEAHG